MLSLATVRVFTTVAIYNGCGGSRLPGENGTDFSILLRAANESCFSGFHSGVYTTKKIHVGHLFFVTFTKIVVMVVSENFLIH